MNAHTWLPVGEEELSSLGIQMVKSDAWPAISVLSSVPSIASHFRQQKMPLADGIRIGFELTFLDVFSVGIAKKPARRMRSNSLQILK